MLKGVASGITSGTNTFTGTLTLTPAANVSALVVNGHDGGNTAGTHNVATTITGGTKQNDVALVINKPSHDSQSALDINLLSTNGGGFATRWFTNFSSVRAMAAQVTNNATFASGNALFSGTHSNAGSPEDDSFVYPIVTDSPNLAVWSDTPIAVQVRVSSAVGAYTMSYIDKNANYVGSVEADGSRGFGVGATRASMDTFLGRGSTAGTIQAGTTVGAANGNFSGASVRGNAVAFASLPASPVEGMHAAVTDSTTAVWGATITGSGANHVGAYYNGTNWTVEAK